MNAKFPHQARKPDGTTTDDTTGQPRSLEAYRAASRACCCPARPVVRVLMPPTASRPREVDLLLCGHHYRVSCEALAAAGATVTELPEMAGNRPVALLPDPLEYRVPVSRGQPGRHGTSKEEIP